MKTLKEMYEEGYQQAQQEGLEFLEKEVNSQINHKYAKTNKNFALNEWRLDTIEVWKERISQIKSELEKVGK